MPEQSTPQSKHDNSAILWDIVQTFSDEAQIAAKKKAIEQGYPLDRGNIPFDETLINLTRNRDVLLKSIENVALPQLPLKIQSQLIADARKVSTQLTLLINGGDATLPFENAVDDLTATIWYSNLQNMSGEVLGLQEKLNQLKTLEKTLRQLSERAESFKLSEERAQNGLARLDGALTSVEGSVENMTRIVQEAQQQLDSSKASEQQVNAVLTVVQQNERNATESAANARASSAEVDSLRTRSNTAVSELEQTRSAYTVLTAEITSFKTGVESDLKQVQEDQKKSYTDLDARSVAELSRLSRIADEAEAARVKTSSTQLINSKNAFEAEAAKVILANKEALDLAEDRAKVVVSESESKTKERFDELLKLEDVFREKIRLATNFQLFHAFNTRQLAIAKEKNFWRNALFVVVGCSFLLAVSLIAYLFMANPTYNAAFFLKLSISIPIVYAIHFCSTEYSKERKLEEEYAFKGNISISLEPYRELVEKLINKNDPVEAAKYSDFVITSIDRVFTSPMQSIFGTRETKIFGKNEKVTADEVAETSKGLSKILGSVSDLVQSLSKLK